MDWTPTHRGKASTRTCGVEKPTIQLLLWPGPITQQTLLGTKRHLRVFEGYWLDIRGVQHVSIRWSRHRSHRLRHFNCQEALVVASLETCQNTSGRLGRIDASNSGTHFSHPGPPVFPVLVSDRAMEHLDGRLAAPTDTTKIQLNRPILHTAVVTSSETAEKQYSAALWLPRSRAILRYYSRPQGRSPAWGSQVWCAMFL
jgi:hypothetical protein